MAWMVLFLVVAARELFAAIVDRIQWFGLPAGERRMTVSKDVGQDSRSPVRSGGRIAWSR